MRAKEVFEEYLFSRCVIKEPPEVSNTLKLVHEKNIFKERCNYLVRKTILYTAIFICLATTLVAVPQTRAAFGWFFKLWQQEEKPQTANAITVDMKDFVFGEALSLVDGQMAAIYGELHGCKVFIVRHPTGTNNGSLTNLTGEEFTVKKVRISSTNEAKCYIDEDGIVGVMPVKDNILFVSMSDTDDKEIFASLLRSISIN